MGIDRKLWRVIFENAVENCSPQQRFDSNAIRDCLVAWHWNQFRRCAYPLPENLKVGSYEDQGLVFMERDRYGQPLNFTTPDDLRGLELPGDLSPWNRAVIAFLLSIENLQPQYCARGDFADDSSSFGSRRDHRHI